MPEDNGGGTPGEGGKKEDAPKTFDEKYVKELRDENAKRRIEAKELKETVGELKQQLEEMSGPIRSIREALGHDPNKNAQEPLEALGTEVAALKQGFEAMRQKAETEAAAKQSAQVSFEIKTKAMVLGLADGVDASDVEKLMDRTGVSFDAEAGEVVGVDGALAAMKADKPYLFNEENAKAPPAGTPGGGTPPGRRRGGDDDTLTARLQKRAEQNIALRGFNPLGQVGAQPNPQQR